MGYTQLWLMPDSQKIKGGRVVLGSNPGGPKDFSLWNNFNGVRSNSLRVRAVAGYTLLYVGAVYARLSKNKRGKSVATVLFLTA